MDREKMTKEEKAEQELGVLDVTARMLQTMDNEEGCLMVWKCVLQWKLKNKNPTLHQKLYRLVCERSNQVA